MTIEDIKKAKDEAEGRISEILTKFENDFGVSVHNVTIESTNLEVSYYKGLGTETTVMNRGKKASIEVRL